MNNTLIIIPTYNESQNVEEMIESVLPKYQDHSLLIVDDNSPDKTYELVQKKQNKYSNLHLIIRKEKSGLGRAYIAGFNWAIENNFKYIITMDCDFSHDPQVIIDLEEYKNDHAMVIGSRYLNNTARVVNWPLKRLILSKLAALYTRIITGIPVSDPTGGFNLYQVEYLKKINLNKVKSNGYAFQIEMKYYFYSRNFSLKEVPIVFTERENGISKMSTNIIWEAVFSVIIFKIRNIIGLYN